MRAPSSAAENRLRHLMMAALDGEVDEEGRRELEGKLKADPDLKAEWDRMVLVKEVTNDMKLNSPPEKIWVEYWSSVYSRIERGVGWIFFSLGAIVLVSYGAWKAVEDLVAAADVPGFVKVAVIALLVGTVVLGVSVIREKLFIRRNDPYKDVHQ